MIWQLGATAFASYAGLPTLWMRWASRHALRRGPGDRPEVALTFDDGPDPTYTPRVLAALAASDVKATFFMLGKRAAAHPDVARAVVSAGHEVGSHMYHHRPVWLLAPGALRRELTRASESIAAAIGRPPDCFRPPWGIFSAAMFSSVGRALPTVLWSVHPGDWRPGIKPEQITARVLRRLSPGAIILLHDGTGYPGDPAALIAALPGIIAQIRDRGYRFVRLSRWLGGGPPEGVPDAQSVVT